MQRVSSMLIGTGLCLSCLFCASCPHSAPDSAAKAAPGRATGPTAPTTAPAASAPFTWRTLAQDLPGPDGHAPPDEIAPLVVGRFIKGSADQQGLQLGKAGSRLLLADLSSRPAAIQTSDIVPDEVRPWDYDCDGVDDLLFSPILSRAQEEDCGHPDAPNGSAVFGLDGQFLGVVPSDMSSTVAIGDFDGDGFKDVAVLPLIAYKEFDAPVYGKAGNRIGMFHLAEREQNNLAGDIDGDGTDELVRFIATSAQPVLAYNLKQPRQVLTEWPANAVPPHLIASLSGTKREDLLSSDALWNSAQGKLVPLGGAPAQDGGHGVDGLLALVQAVAGAGRWLVVLPVDPAGQERQLKFYNATGQEVHRETLPSDARGITSLEAGGIEHLVVQLEHQLLIYP